MTAEWFQQLTTFLDEQLKDGMPPAEIGKLVHQGLVLVEAEKYAEPHLLYLLRFDQASWADLEEIERQLSPRENQIVRIARPWTFIARPSGECRPPPIRRWRDGHPPPWPRGREGVGAGTAASTRP